MDDEISHPLSSEVEKVDSLFSNLIPLARQSRNKGLIMQFLKMNMKLLGYNR